MQPTDLRRTRPTARSWPDQAQRFHRVLFAIDGALKIPISVLRPDRDPILVGIKFCCLAGRHVTAPETAAIVRYDLDRSI